MARSLVPELTAATSHHPANGPFRQPVAGDAGPEAPTGRTGQRSLPARPPRTSATHPHPMTTERRTVGPVIRPKPATPHSAPSRLGRATADGIAPCHARLPPPYHSAGAALAQFAVPLPSPASPAATALGRPIRTPRRRPPQTPRVSSFQIPFLSTFRVPLTDMAQHHRCWFRAPARCRPEAGVPSRPRASTQSVVRRFPGRCAPSPWRLFHSKCPAVPERYALHAVAPPPLTRRP